MVFQRSCLRLIEHLDSLIYVALYMIYVFHITKLFTLPVFRQR